MARLILFAVAASSLVAALPAAAQDHRPESARDAGLRYLTWPGRPPASRTPERAARPTPTTPRRARPPQPRPETAEPQQAPETRVAVEPASRPAAPPAPASARYYSLHRPTGRAPDPIEGAQTLAAEDTLVALQSPQGQTLAEQDQTARADEAFEILRSLPPDQLMDMLGRQP